MAHKLNNRVAISNKSCLFPKCLTQIACSIDKLIIVNAPGIKASAIMDSYEALTPSLLRKKSRLYLILHQPGLGVPMVFNTQTPSLSPIVLDFPYAEKLSAISNLPHLVQNLRWHLQFTGRQVTGLAGLPKNHHYRLAIMSPSHGPSDSDGVANTAVSI
jgi:hypothetical protein